MIRFENVTKSYGEGIKAVKSVDLQINEGEFFVLIGPSGCGKTTTLKMINRLIDLSEGSIYINDKNIRDYDIHELRWNIGYVLQQIALFPHMTIEENIAIVPELKSWDRQKVKHRADELLGMVGLDPHTYRNRKPGEISGGQQQRIGVVRALAADPDIILMDEPFSALDPISREKLQKDIVMLQKEIRKTIVFVTHDIQEAMALGDRICLMKDGEIVQLDTPANILQNPANNFVREFIGIGKNPLTRHSTLEDVVAATLQRDRPLSGKTISASLKVEESFYYFAKENEISIEKEGNVIGVLTRQDVFQYLSETKYEGRSL